MGGLKVTLYLRRVRVARGHGDQLPQAVQVHCPRKPVLALDIDQAVEAPRYWLPERVGVCGVQGLEVVLEIGAYDDVVEAQGVMLACPTLALFRPVKVHSPEPEPVALELLVLARVEGVLGVDVGSGQPVERVPEVFVVGAGVSLTQDL